MKQKLTKDDVFNVLCDHMGEDCDNCPYYRPKGKVFGHCNIREEVSKFFSSVTPSKQWVEQIWSKFAKDNHIVYSRVARYVVIADVAKDTMAFALCSRRDNFDLRVGTAIAYARLRGLPVHPEYASKTDKVLGRDD